MQINLIIEDFIKVGYYGNFFEDLKEYLDNNELYENVLERINKDDKLKSIVKQILIKEKRYTQNGKRILPEEIF